MSASTIARWNAIPMNHPQYEPSTSNKRSGSPDYRSDSGSESEDNVSLISRSPSPDVERERNGEDVNLYDEHRDVRGVARERVTVDTKISSSNRGFALLAKMGWTEGKPVGIAGDGRVDPVPFTLKYDMSGLGKYRKDFEVIETTVSQRRNLDSERMRNETAEQRQQREANVAQKAAVASEVSQTLRAFYCDYCDKQFTTVAQYDEHTNSYAHHHKVRARDMASHHPVRAAGKEESEKRKEKERKREEKELKKIAKAAGIKITTPAGSDLKPNAQPALAVPSAGQDAPQSEAKKSGWASVGTASQDSAPTKPKGGGWAAVSSPGQPAAPRNPNWQNATTSTLNEAGTSNSADTTNSAPPNHPVSGNTFRSGGFTTLATTSSPSSPPLPTSQSSSGWARLSENSPPPPPPSSAPKPPPSVFGNPTDTPSPSGPPPAPSSSSQPPSQYPPPPTSTDFSPLGLSSIASNPAPPASAETKKKKKSKDGAPAEEPQSRGSWQSFQKNRGRR